jgi:hypothetical protein
MSEPLTESGEGMQRAPCARAHANLQAAIDQTRRLPQNVFTSVWTRFFIFDPSWMFHDSFVDVIKRLLHLEGARCACVVNLDIDVWQGLPAFAIDATTTREAYQSPLYDSPGFHDAWILNFGSFGCTSDVGTWCIYTERAEDMAFLGFRDDVQDARFQDVLEALHACSPHMVGVDPDRFEFFPGTYPEAKAQIIRNYQRGS